MPSSHLAWFGNDEVLYALPACEPVAGLDLRPLGPVDADRRWLPCGCGCSSNVGKPPLSLSLATDRWMSLRRNSDLDRPLSVGQQQQPVNVGKNQKDQWVATILCAPTRKQHQVNFFSVFPTTTMDTFTTGHRLHFLYIYVNCDLSLDLKFC